MNDVYLNEINWWVGMYDVGKLVMVLNAEKMFDEIAKRQSEDAAGNLFSRMTPLCHNMVVCSQFCITIGEFWNGWDPEEGLAKILGVMLYSKHQENHCDKSFIDTGKAEELLLPSRDDEKSCSNICVNKRNFGMDTACVAVPICSLSKINCKKSTFQILLYEGQKKRFLKSCTYSFRS